MTMYFDYLLGEQERPKADSYRFGTVISAIPLRVRLDGDTTTTEVTPTALVQVGTTDRVLCQFHGKALWIVGRVGGAGAGTRLGATENFNDLMASGDYHQQYSANASLALNYPVAEAGWLRVFNATHLSLPGDETAYVYQTYTLYNGTRQYIRTFYKDAWNPWREVQLPSPWISATLQNGWQNYTTWSEGARYRLVGDRVEFAGLVRNGTVGPNIPIFTLPSNMRPKVARLLITSHPTMFIDLRVDTAGRVYVQSGTPSWINLENVSFTLY